MMKTIAVSKSSQNEGVNESKLNITKPHPISCNISSKQQQQETTFSSPYLSNSQILPARQINLKNCSTDDNEISIFDAQKYFNEGREQSQNQNHTIKSSSPVSKPEKYNLPELPRYSSISSSSIGTYNARNNTTRSFYATPTASSEASWNSQTGLLSNPPGTIKVSLRNPTPIPHKSGKPNNPKWFFRRHCPCIGKKSTQVDNNTISSETKSPIHFRSITQTNLSKTQRSPTKKSNDPPVKISLTATRNDASAAGFSFPILNPTPKNLEEPRRDSLEIFNPSYSNHNNPTPKTTSDKLVEDEEDAASDGSSDLFDLESFTTQSTTPYQIYNNNNNNNFQNSRRISIITSTSSNNYGYRRNSLEEPATPSVAATEGYAPSEVSIDWSVTTEEGFDRASVATYDEMVRDGGGGGGGERRNGGSGLLGLGCRSEKAVLVGPGPRRVGPGLIGGVPGSQHKPPLAGRPMNR